MNSREMRNEHEALDHYLAKFPPAALSASEQDTLAEWVRDTKDQAASALLWRSTIKLVVKLAHQWHRKNLDTSLMELVSEGSIGYAQCFKSFKTEKGPFNWHMLRWANSRMQRYIMDEKRPDLKTTGDGRAIYSHLREFQEVFREWDGTEEGMKRLAEQYGFNGKKLLAAMQYERPISLQTPWGEDGLTIEEKVAHSGELPEEYVARKQQPTIQILTEEAFKRMVTALNTKYDQKMQESESEQKRGEYEKAKARRHELLMKRGVRYRGNVAIVPTETGVKIYHHDEVPTLETVGGAWGITRERVRQIEYQSRQLFAAHLEEVIAEHGGREAFF